MASTGSTSFDEFGFFYKQKQIESDFRKQVELPSLLASHAWKSHHVSIVMKHATKDSLIIFSHREETDRFMSAIKQTCCNISLMLCEDGTASEESERFSI